MRFHWPVACDSTWPRDHPGSSTRRLSAALATLTKEMPTFIVTTGSCSVSKVTKAPHALDRHEVTPGETVDPLHVPAAANGRLNVA